MISNFLGVVAQIAAFWVFTQCIIIGLTRRFGETCRLHLPIDQIWFRMMTVAFVHMKVNACYARDSSISRNAGE
jgi:hypothetical protein